MLSEKFEVSLYFFNPNIWPKEEYERRLDATKKAVENLGIEVMEGEYSEADWLSAVADFKDEPEGGKRCEACFDFRLAETARFAKENDFDHKFLRAARAINNSMPGYTVEIFQEMLNQIEKPLKGTNIGVLGVSYKANVGDLRESPALKVIELLEKHGAKLHIFDPYLPEHSNVKNIDELLEKSEAVVLLTNHKEFLEIKPEKYKKNKIKAVMDGMNCLDKEEFLKAGLIFKGIGR